MPRPTKWRHVDYVPEVTFFQPIGSCLRQIDEVCLSIEETEAIRLKDMEGLRQEECAERMDISRPTFHRVLESARRKVAEALINGKAIRIKGGNFEMARRYFRCSDDGHEWNLPFEAITTSTLSTCPRCKSPNVLPIPGPGIGRRKRHRSSRWQQQKPSQIS